MVHFSRSQIIRLGRLLNMRYRPSEIASEINCCTDTVYRSYIPAGCPHTRDETGHLWIVGTAFAEWARDINSRENKRSLSDGEAFCMKCRKPVRMAEPITVRPTNHHLELVTGMCPECGTPVNRARARRQDNNE